MPTALREAEEKKAEIAQAFKKVRAGFHLLGQPLAMDFAPLRIDHETEFEFIGSIPFAFPSTPATSHARCSLIALTRSLPAAPPIPLACS